MSKSILSPNPFSGPIPYARREGDRFSQAQVEATYALAYEQRTANLIACAQLLSADGLHPEVEHVLLPDIRERVGLDTIRDQHRGMPVAGPCERPAP